MKTVLVVMVLASSPVFAGSLDNLKNKKDEQELPSLGTERVVRSPIGIGAFRLHYDLGDKAIFLSTEPTEHHLLGGKVTTTVKVQRNGFELKLKF